MVKTTKSMKEKSILKAAMTSAALSLCILFPSCVNEEYEVSEEKLNLEVTVFQEGVVLPLGSTSKIMVKDLMAELDPEVADFFEKNADGSYSIGMKGDYDLSENLDFLKDVASIKSMRFDKDIPFSFVNVDVSGLSFGPYSYPYEKYLSEVIPSFDITIPQIAPSPVVQKADINKYLPDADLSIPAPEKYDYLGKIATLNLDYEILDNIKDDMVIPLKGLEVPGISITTFDKFDFSDEPLEVLLRFKLPEQVKGVSEVTFAEGAGFTLGVEVKNSIFYSGAIIPHLTMDLHEIFHMNGITNDILKADFILDENDKYSDSKTYYISSMLVYPEDIRTIDGEVWLEKSITVVPEVTLDLDGLTTTPNLLAQHKGEDVVAHVTMEFKDFKVADIEMSVNPIAVPVEQKITLDVPDIELNKYVSSVEEVTFTKDSGFDLNISASEIALIDGLDLSIETLELTFPKEIKVAGADASGKLTMNVGSLKGGSVSRHIGVEALRPSGSQDGRISIGGEIGIRATAVVSGDDIHTAQLLEVGDINVKVSASGNLEVEDFKAVFAGYEQKIEINPDPIREPVSDNIAELGTLSVELEGNPAVTLHIELPDSEIPITASSGGLSVKFPDMLVFGGNLPEGFDKSNNTFTITGVIPEGTIVLPIEKMMVTPEKVGQEWFVIDQVEVNGGVAIQACTMTRKELEAFTSPEAKVVFNASVSELKPVTVGIKEYTASVTETIGFEDFKITGLPEELVSIGLVELDEVYLNMQVKVPGINAIVKDADVNLDLDVTLPSFINVAGGTLENGVLSIPGALNDKEEIVVDPVKIESMDLSGIDIWAEDPFKDLNIGVKGDIKVSDAVIDLAALENAKLELIVNADIRTAGQDEKICISKVTGRVDYEIDPVIQTLDLSEFMSSLNSENLTTELDINRFNIKLDVETNIKVPVEATLSLTPYKGEVAGTPLTPKNPVKLVCPEISGESAFTRLWISNTSEGMLEGYEFVELDLISMIKEMPDRVDFSLSAYTDTGKDCEFVPSVDYILKADYAAEIPLELGDDFKLEFTETIGDLPEDLGSILEMGSLALVGDITSSLPLQLELRMSLLDSEGNEVELAENAGTQIIKSCALDGSPVKTDLNILMKVKPGAEVSDIASLGLTFRATSGGVSGVAITDETFVQASLQALIPEGVSIDLGQYLNGEENNK